MDIKILTSITNRLRVCREHRFLSAFLDGELDGTRRESVERHLALCQRCRSNYDDMRRVSHLVSRIPVPDEANPRFMANADASVAHLARCLSKDDLSDGLRRHRWNRPTFLDGKLRVAIVATLLILLGIGFWRYVSSPRIHLRIGSSTLSRIETLARDIHEQMLRGSLLLDLSSELPADIRRWVGDHSELEAELADHQPEGEGRYEPLGARSFLFEGIEVVAVFYRIDSHPITLLLAKRQNLEGAPEEGVLSKNVIFHSQNGLKFLTWSKDGQAYVLVSDLPNFGQQSCFICHTAEKRRQLITGMLPGQ